MEWVATVEGTLAGAPRSSEDWEQLSASTGATISFNSATRAVSAVFAVEAQTARQAMTAALARRAFPGRVEAVRVATAERIERELRAPAVPDLVGTSEAAGILGVSRQRIPQLAADHDDFPRPVATLAAGPVYTKASIEAFGQRWERRRTGRPKAS